MLFTLIFGDNFFYFIILANCAIDESCTEKLAPICPKGPKFVVQAVFLCTACIDEELQQMEFSQMKSYPAMSMQKVKELRALRGFLGPPYEPKI